MKTQIFRNNAFCTLGVLRHVPWRGSTVAGLLLAAGALGVLAPAPVVADDVAAGIDVWTTPPGSEAAVTIPADFFGPGSDPFDGPIAVQGEPFPGQSFDTVIGRLGPAVLAGCPAQATIDVEIVALSLVSSAPFTVTFNGGQDPEDYDVHVCLSDCHSLALPDASCPGLTAADLLGGMTIHHDCPAGGTFDSSFPVYAKFTFTPVGGGPDLVLDVGFEGLPPETIATDSPGGWSHQASPGYGVVVLAPGLQVDGNCDEVLDAPLPGTSNFVAGIRPAKCDCASTDKDTSCGSMTFEGAHRVATGMDEAQPVGCCLNNGQCVKTTDEICHAISNLYVAEDACRKPEPCYFQDGTWTLMDPACCTCRGRVPHQAKTELTALLLGNTNYASACEPDLPGVIGDVLNKQNALENAGWAITSAPNQSAAGMADVIWKRLPTLKKDTEVRYIVWYSGHGDTDADGALVGVDCANLAPQDLVDALKDAKGSTLVILDSCASGAFADAVNAINSDIGFITASTDTECVPAGPQKSPFSECFVEGLNGAADAGSTGEAPGEITVAEAAAYAIANCGGDGYTPTWDLDHGSWVIGALKIEKDRVFLHRSVTEPDADPENPISDPTGSWVELYPMYLTPWMTQDWRDNGSGELDKGDYLLMDVTSQWYRVQRATVTIEVTQKECLCSVGGGLVRLTATVPVGRTCALARPWGLLHTSTTWAAATSDSPARSRLPGMRCSPSGRGHTTSSLGPTLTRINV